MITFRLKKPPQIVEMAANGQLVFTDVDKVTFKGVGNTSNAVIDTTTGKIGVGVDNPDANLHVLGNCFVSTNFELGGTMSMGTVTVRAQHELSAITATGNTTPHTVEFQNATTGFVTTGNVSVGKELTVSGNVEVGTANLFVDTVNSRVGVGTTTPGSALDVVGDAAISSNLEVANSKFSLDTNGTLKHFGGGGNSKYIKLMKYFGDASNWKIATGSYTGPSYQWVSIRANITRLDQDVEIIQFNYLGHNGTSRVRNPIIIGGGATSTQANEIKVYNKTADNTYEIYLQIDSATSVEVEISHRNSTIDDDYSTVSTANNGAIDETGLTKIYDSGTTADLRLRNGNVGIGTTNPQDITHIWKDGANDAHGLLIEQNNAGTGSATLRFGVAHAGESTAGLSKAGIFFKRAASNGRGDLLFCMDNANDTNDVDTSNHALTIYRNGNVGIGTSSPSSIFNTYGGALWDGSSMSSKVCATLQVGRGGGTGSAANDTGFGGILEFRHHSDSRFVTIESVSEAAYSASIGLSFKTHGGTGDGERMRIAGNGNVGIGTTSPGSTLDVHGTGIHIDGTVLRSYSSIGAMTAGTWYKVCDFSALPATVAGVCAIRIKWGGGSLTNVGTYYWSGYASGIVSYNTYNNGSGTYTAAPQEPLTLNQHYHHRAAGAFEFMLDGDASGGSYGYQSIYIKSPQELSSLSLEVIAMPLRR